MGFFAVIVAAAAAFAAGAIYYMVLAKPWMAAAKIEVGPDGKPANTSPVPYIVSFVMILLVAGMMRHTFALSGIEGVGKGLVAGFGIGAFFISPWIFVNTGYSDRPWMLAAIDSGYAILAATIMGLILAVL